MCNAMTLSRQFLAGDGIFDYHPGLQVVANAVHKFPKFYRQLYNAIKSMLMGIDNPVALIAVGLNGNLAPVS